MRTRYRYDPTSDKVVESHLAPPRCGVFAAISDTMDAAVHPIDGKMYDSKSAFRAVTRAHGCTEVGNETIPDRVDRSLPSGLGEAIGRAYDELGGR